MSLIDLKPKLSVWLGLGNALGSASHANPFVSADPRTSGWSPAFSTCGAEWNVHLGTLGSRTHLPAQVGAWEL